MSRKVRYKAWLKLENFNSKKLISSFNFIFQILIICVWLQEKNGLEKIEVKDNGCGIEKSDGLVMCLPSYTSKISDFSDLGVFKLSC